MTDDEIRSIWQRAPAGTSVVDFARAVMAAATSATAAPSEPVAGWSDEQVMEFGALCVMNRRSLKTAREMFEKFSEARQPSAKPTKKGTTP